MAAVVPGGGGSSAGIIRKLESAGLALACLCVCATMLIVASDTLLRYALGSPWPWAVDVTTNYLLVGAAYLGISATYTMGDHINIDLLHRRLPLKFRSRVDAILALLFLIVFGTIGYLALRESISAAMSKAYIPGYVPWPVWLSFAPIPLGTLILCIRMSHHLLMLLTKGSDPFVSGPHIEEAAE